MGSGGQLWVGGNYGGGERIEDMGYVMYGVWDRGCRVWGAGYGIQDVGCRMQDVRYGVWGAGYGAWGWSTACRVRAEGAGCGLGAAMSGAMRVPGRPGLQLPSALTAGSGRIFLIPPGPAPPRTTPPAIPRTGSGRPRGGGASAAGREEERAELRWRRRRCWSSSARSPCCPPTARRPSASCTPSVSPGAPRDPSVGSRPIPSPSVPRRGRLLTHGAARPAGLGAAGPEWRGLGWGRVGVWGLRLPVGLSCDVWGSGCGAVRAV